MKEEDENESDAKELVTSGGGVNGYLSSGCIIMNHLRLKIQDNYRPQSKQVEFMISPV
jgi:hypothetical protein